MAEYSNEITVRVGSCEVRVSGAVEFVEKKFDELAEVYLSPSSSIGKIGESVVNAELASASEKGDIGTLYSVDPESGKLSIHGKVPGNSKSERMRNVALITLFCINSDDPLSSMSIREMCIEQACLDQSNFAAAIKKDKKNFVISGKGADWLAKLTVFGKEKARDLLEEMLNG